MSNKFRDANKNRTPKEYEFDPEPVPVKKVGRPVVKERTEPTRRLSIELEVSAHQALKIHVASKGKSIQEFVEALILNELDI